MKNLEIKEEFIRPGEHRNNKDIESVSMVNTMVVFSGGAFENCSNLDTIYFGLDITRIGNRTFANCSSLKDVWFAITDKDKIIEIAEDAFDGCEQPITFHIFASAIDNLSLNRYAKKHGFRVVSMI